MGVNRFMSPVKTQYMQTAVDQHVPLPFELMQKRAEAEQKHFDENKANMQALTDRMGEDLLNIDNPAQSNAISDLRGRLDSAIDDYNGDWRKMDDVIRNVANQYNSEVKTGKLALGKHNKAVQTEAFKAVDESNATSDIKDLEKRFMSVVYNESGGIINNAEYQTIAPITIDEKLVPNILKNLNDLKESGNEKAFTFYQDGKDIIIDRKEGWEGIDKTRYVDAIKGLVEENPQWNDQILKEFRMKDKLGELPQGVDNLEDYRQERLESQFLGLAGGRAHSDRNESQTSKQSAEAKAKADSQALYDANFTTNLNVNGSGDWDYGIPGTEGNVFDGENGESFLSTDIQSKFVGLRNDVYKALELQNNGATSATSAVTINKNLASAGFRGYDFKDDNDATEIMMAVAQGTLSPSLFGINPSSLQGKRLLNQAKSIQQNYDNSNALRYDVVNDMLSAQGINKKQATILRDHIGNIDAAKARYSKAKHAYRASTDPTAEVEKEMMEAEIALNNVSEPDTYIHGNMFATEMLQLGLTDATSSAFPGGISKISDLYTDFLNSRLSHNKNSKTGARASAAITQDEEYNQSLQNTLKGSLSEVLRQKIKTKTHPEGMSVSELIREQERQLAGLPEDLNEDEQKILLDREKLAMKKIEDSPITFANVLNDKGEIVMNIGGFAVPLSTDGYNIPALKNVITPKVMKDMRRQTLLSKVRNSSGDGFNYSPGIKLVPDLHVKNQGKDKLQLSNIQIVIDKDKYDVGETDFVITPEYSERYVEMLDRIEENLEKGNGSFKGLNRQELISRATVDFKNRYSK